MLEHTYPYPIKPERVLLLGAGGFVVPELLRSLAESGTPARAIGSREIDLAVAGAGGNLASAILPGDAIVMAAALTPDKGRDNSTLMRNLRMAEAVCAAIAEAPPSHFVYISSDAVYDARFTSLLNEESTCEPTDLYSLMHISRERMLRHICSAKGVPFLVVRPCAIYGVGDTHNSYGPNRFYRNAQKDRKITLFGGGEETRHHIHVSDVAELIRLSLHNRSTGTLNAVTGKAVSFAWVAEKVAKAVGGPIVIEKTPRANPVTHRHFDISAIARAFPGFRETPLDSGLERMVGGLEVVAP